MAKKREPIDSNMPLEDAIKLLETIERQFGISNDISPIMKIKTNLLPVDYIFGEGIATKSIIEIVGKAGSGKSTIASIIANAITCTTGKKTYYMDFERTLDPEWLLLNGVDITKLDEQGLFKIVQLDGSEAIQFIDKTVRTGAVGCVIIDSLPMMVFNEEQNKEKITDPQIGTKARNQTLLFGLIQSMQKDVDTVFIIINQYRNKITAFGGYQTSAGPIAKEHAKSYAIEIDIKNKSEVLITDNNKKTVGVRSDIKCTKNKHGRPYMSGLIHIFFPPELDDTVNNLSAEELISKLEELQNKPKGMDFEYNNAYFLVSNGFIEKKGSYYYVKEQGLQGFDALVSYLKKNPECYATLIEEFWANEDTKHISRIQEVVDKHKALVEIEKLKITEAVESTADTEVVAEVGNAIVTE